MFFICFCSYAALSNYYGDSCYKPKPTANSTNTNIKNNSTAYMECATDLITRYILK